MRTNDGHTDTGATPPGTKGAHGYRWVHRTVVRGVLAAGALGAVGVVSAQSASNGAASGAGGGGLLITAAALGLTALAIGAVYLFSWRERPEPTFRPEPARETTVPARQGGPMLESDVAVRETESVDHDAFDPRGTGTLLAVYFAIIALMWLFMYFVEFLGNGPSVVG